MLLLPVGLDRYGLVLPRPTLLETTLCLLAIRIGVVVIGRRRYRLSFVVANRREYRSSSRIAVNRAVAAVALLPMLLLLFDLFFFFFFTTEILFVVCLFRCYHALFF